MKEGYGVFLTPFLRSIFGILENIIIVGSILGKLIEARKLVYEILNELSTPKRKLAESIYVEFWLGDDIATCGSLTYVDDMLSWIGLQNIFSDVIAEFFKPNFNHVKVRNPDLIVVNYEPYPKHRGRHLVYWKSLRRGNGKILSLLRGEDNIDRGKQYYQPSSLWSINNY